MVAPGTSAKFWLDVEGHMGGHMSSPEKSSSRMRLEMICRTGVLCTLHSVVGAFPVLVFELAVYVEGKVKWSMLFELCTICKSYVRTILMLSFFLASESSSTTLFTLVTTLVFTGSISTATSDSSYPLVGLGYLYFSFRHSDILGKFPVDFVSEVGKGLIIHQGHLWPSHVELECLSCDI